MLITGSSVYNIPFGAVTLIAIFGARLEFWCWLCCNKIFVEVIDIQNLASIFKNRCKSWTGPNFNYFIQWERSNSVTMQPSDMQGIISVECCKRHKKKKAETMHEKRHWIFIDDLSNSWGHNGTQLLSLKPTWKIAGISVLIKIIFLISWNYVVIL